MTDPRLQPHKHKVALITGGCGGLGKVIADAFLACGADVVVCDINPSLIASFNQNLAPVYPGSTLVLECDVTDDAAIERMFDAAELKFGRVDYVVNNAGMIDRFDPVGEMEREAWDRVLALNLTAPAMVTKRGVNGMLRGNVKGVVVNIGSIAGVRGFTNGAAYTSSKHGLLGLTKNTAAYYGPKFGIRCNAILAGAMETNITAPILTQDVDGQANGKRNGKGFNVEGVGVVKRSFPDDSIPLLDVAKVAKLVLYLCSEEADIVNGACWTVDGGATAN